MISIKLELFLLLVTLVYFAMVLKAVKKGTMPIKSSILWFLIGFIMIFLLLWPELLIKLSSFVGIKTISNLLLFGAVMALLMLAFDLYKINNMNKIKNITLAQEVGIIKHELYKKK